MVNSNSEVIYEVQQLFKEMFYYTRIGIALGGISLVGIVLLLTWI